MPFYVTNKDIATIGVQHDGKEITYPLKSAYNKTIISGKTIDGKYEGPFDVVNKFIDTLPKSSVGALFSIFHELADYTSDEYDIRNITEANRVAVIDIFQVPCMGMEDIHDWVTRTTPIPDGVNEDYNSNKGTFTRETTYIKREYLHLVSTILVFKIIMPIVAGHLAITDKLKGDYKEAALMDDIISARIKDMSGYKYLYTYVDNQITKSIGSGNIFNADMLHRKDVNSETVRPYIFAQLLLTRFMGHTLFNLTHGSHIITTLYAHINNKARSGADKTVISKLPMSSASFTKDGEATVRDSFRFKDTHDLAEKQMLEHTGNYEYYLPLLGDSLDHKEFRRLLPKMIHMPIYQSELHIIILKSVFSPLLPIIAFNIYNPQQIASLMVAAHLIMRENHPYLSMIMLSSLGMTEEGELKPAPHTKSRQRLPPELADKLMEQIPITTTSGKRTVDIAVTTVGTLSTATIRHWDVMMPIKFIRKDLHKYLISGTSQLAPDSTAKSRIAEFILDSHNLVNRESRMNELFPNG